MPIIYQIKKMKSIVCRRNSESVVRFPLCVFLCLSQLRIDSGIAISIDDIEVILDILPTQEGRDIVLGAQKNELNMLMAKAFGLSLTKQFLKIDVLENYSGLKIEKD